MFNFPLKKLFSFSLILVSIIASLVDAQEVDTLPIFRVKSSYSGEKAAVKLRESIFGKVKYNTSYYDSRFVARALDNSSILEVDLLSGGIWIADETRLWNTSHRSKGSNVTNPRGAAESLI